MRVRVRPTSARRPRAYSGLMNEEYFYADVNLPFHVWVRERSEAGVVRWVLREAAHLRVKSSPAYNDSRTPPTSPSLPTD